MTEDNPFDELGIDPSANAREITDALRKRAQKAAPEERERIKKLWRRLTLNDDERVRLALRAHPQDPDIGQRSIDELARRVPPVRERIDPPPITATIEDALLDESSESAPPEICGPPTAFADISDLADPTRD